MLRKLSLPFAAFAASSAPLFLALAPPALAQTSAGWNTYTADTNSSLVVTWRHNDTLNARNADGTFSNKEVRIDIAVGDGSKIPVIVDTGSTGVAIAKKVLLDTNPDALKGLTSLGKGTFNYDSSGINPTGDFYQLPLSIFGTVNGNSAVGNTTIKVLVVTSDDNTTYFGIGNNRNNVYSGTAVAGKTIKEQVKDGTLTPISPVDMNPLLDVSTSGKPLTNQGYVVMNDQLVVGLTKANNGYSFVKLVSDASAGAANLWNGIPVALSSSKESTYNAGTVLHDTGIGNAYVRIVPKTDGGGSGIPPVGGTIDVSLAGQPQQAGFYSFQVPREQSGTCASATSVTPCKVEESTDKTPFINTGRQFFSGFNYLFDPVNGYVGYALSSSGLSPDSVVNPLLVLQSTVDLPSGFVTNLPVALLDATTLKTTKGATATFDSAFSGYGNSLTVSGHGKVIFNGAVNLTSSGGTFSVDRDAHAAINGTLTAASIANQGTLSGNGTIIGDVNNSGTISPGNSIGTLTVAGNYTHTTGGAHLAEVSPAGIGDKIVISGKAALQGGSLNVVAQPGVYAPRTTYTLITAGNGVSGQFASATTDTFLQPTLSYDANNAYLTLQIGGFAAAAQTPTQAAVGAALDAGAPNATGDFATILGTIASLNSSQVLPFLTAISGQNYSAFSNSMVQSAQLFMNNFALQVGGGSIGPRTTGGGAGRVALAEACTVACQTFTPPPWGAWGGALGGTGTVGAGTASGSTTYNVGGFAAGLDRLLTSNFLAGVTVGYTTGTQWVSGFSGQSSTNTFQVGLYGSFFEGPFYLDGMASYAYSTNQMWRNIAIPNLQQRTAQGLTGANQFFGQLEGGYRITLGGTAMAFVTPFARLQGFTGTQNAFTETGAQSLNLSVEAQTTNSLRSVIGAQIGGSMDFGWRDRLYAQLRLGWSHEYADVSRPVTAALAGAPRFLFTTFGATPTRDGAVVGLSATTEVAQAAAIYLRYEGNIAGQDSTHALTAGLRMSW
ncbi:MAG: autotransporter domain-containing protein [Reyranellaceae bacterium]